MKIYRSGLIPFYVEKSKVYMLFMRPSDENYGGPDFQISKGKREDGETSEEAAIREASEELGLIEDNIEEIIDMGEFLGRTHIFLAKIKNKDNFGAFHYETGETKWLTLDEFKDVGRIIHYPIVRMAVENYITVENESESSDNT